MPTFLEAAGLKPLKEMSGQSFMNVLKAEGSGRIDPQRDRTYIGKERHDIGRPKDVGYPVRAIRTDDFLYVRNFEPARWPAGNPETFYSNIDNSPSKSLIIDMHEEGIALYWELAMGKRPGEELYDMKTDLPCMHNLAGNAAYAQVKARLWEDLQKKLIAQHDPRIPRQRQDF